MTLRKVFVRNDLNQGMNVIATYDSVNETLFIELDNQPFPEFTNPKSKRLYRLDDGFVPLNHHLNYKSIHYWERR